MKILKNTDVVKVKEGLKSNHFGLIPGASDDDKRQLDFFKHEKMNDDSAIAIGALRSRTSEDGYIREVKKDNNHYQDCANFKSKSGVDISISYDKPQMLIRGAYGATIDLRDIDHMEIHSDSDNRSHWLQIGFGNSHFGIDLD